MHRKNTAQRSKKTSSVAYTLKVLKNQNDSAHTGASRAACRLDDACTLPTGNVLLPFDIYILSYLLTVVKGTDSDLYICTNIFLKFVHYVTKGAVSNAF